MGGETTGKRKRRTAAFKAKVATEAIRGEKTANELAGLYQVHPTQIAAWKKRALDGLTEIFADGRGRVFDNIFSERLHQALDYHTPAEVYEGRRGETRDRAAARTVAGTPVALRVPSVTATVP